MFASGTHVISTVEALRARGVDDVDLGLVFGSGLGATAAALGLERVAGFADLPGWPTGGAIAGHAGELYYGRPGGVGVLAACGRAHLYQNFTIDEVVFNVRVLAALGARVQITTNAVGSLRAELEPRSLVAMTDHVDATWHHYTQDLPANGPPPAQPLRCFDERLLALLEQAARQAGLVLHRGVYAFCRGPQYESAAEVRQLARWGCDVVGMSSVPEAIEAQRLGLRAAAVSVVTNHATGLVKENHSHATVVDTANQAARDLLALLQATLTLYASGSR